MGKKIRLSKMNNCVNPFDIEWDSCKTDPFCSEVAEKALFRKAKKIMEKDSAENPCLAAPTECGKDRQAKLKSIWKQEAENPSPASPRHNKKKAQTKEKAEKGPSLSQISHRVIEKHRIICNWNELYFYNGKNYELLDDKVAIGMIRGEMTDKQKNDIWAFQNSERILNAIKHEHTIDLRLQGREPANHIVTLQNGNLNLLTGEFTRHDPAIITTYAVNANMLDKDADLQTPVWDRYITSAIDGDPDEVLEFIETILGYLIGPSNAAKHFFVFGTAPNSGKSVFENFLHKLVGDVNISNVALNDFGNAFRLSRIVGKVLNISMDLSSKKISDDAANTIKMLTGGDFLPMERKYQMPFEYKNSAKLVFGSNHPVQTVNPDPAFYERMLIVPFMHTVPEEQRDLNLLNQLLRERDEIVTKALWAAMELWENNFLFPTIDCSRKMNRQWAVSVQDTVHCFISDCCIDTGDEMDFVSSQKLMRAYRDYCSQRGFSVGDMKAVIGVMKDYFEGGVRDLPSEKGKRCQARGLKGIRLSVKY